MSAKTKNSIGLALLFIFGMIAGIAVTLIIEGGMIRAALANPDYGRQIAAGRLSRNLDLDANQRETLDEILLDAQEELYTIRVETAPAVERVLQDSRYRIEQVLTPQQKDEFSKMYELFQGARERYGHMHRFRNRHREMGMGQGGPGFGPQGMMPADPGDYIDEEDTGDNPDEGVAKGGSQGQGYRGGEGSGQGRGGNGKGGGGQGGGKGR